MTAVQTLKAADALLPVTILVPHEFLATHLQQAVAKAGDGYLGLHVFTLSEFAKERAEHPLRAGRATTSLVCGCAAGHQEIAC